MNIIENIGTDVLPEFNGAVFTDDVNELFTLDNLMKFLTTYSMIDSDGCEHIQNLIQERQSYFTNVTMRNFLNRKTVNYDLIEVELYTEDVNGIISTCVEDFPITKEDFEANYSKYEKIQLRKCSSEIDIIQKYLFSRYVSLTEINFMSLIIGKLDPVEMTMYISLLERIPQELRYIDDLYMAAFFVIQCSNKAGDAEINLRNYTEYLTFSFPVRKPEKYVLQEGPNELYYRQYLVCDDDWY